MDRVQEFPETQAIARRRVLTRRGGVQSEAGEWRGRPVFVKTLLTDDPEAALRFDHEGRIAGSLTHPLIVPLLARSPNQLIFPFVEGGTLRERVERGPLPLAEALEVTCGVLEAAEYLHAQGVTHHDLKPENVLLANGQGRGQCVRLIDFGMSHSRALPLDVHDGTRMGTPHFMAPEQFRGVRGNPRSDLYSAAVLLFDCLCGFPPYEDALGWLVGLHAECAPLPGPSVLHPILRAALSRDPAGRPDSAAQMCAALREVARDLECRCP
ncbi:serine/threonine-protein kinase [Deinococcus apachensis]|uniref:serine/threonine-protein kinase n=1 Tax=Deinococcus apachensis TaxID=309886 RepID=UPI0003719DF2|nr:serine/threonine-protein kinase [Deinococcus apachensis]